MALTPPWPPLIETTSVRLRSNVGLFRSPITGLTQRVARSGSWWEFDVRLTSVEDSRFWAWRGLLSKLQDEAETMYWGPYPRGNLYDFQAGTGFGTPLVNGGSQTGRSLITDGWTAGAIIYAGDYIAFSNGTYRAMHIVTANTTANGSGEATLPIAPAIVRSPANNAAILCNGNSSDVAERAACEVMIDPETPFAWDIQGYQQTMNFRLIEVPR